MSKPKRLPESQRRTFHRLEILMPVSYKLVSRAGTARKSQAQAWTWAPTINISLGGLLVGGGQGNPRQVAGLPAPRYCLETQKSGLRPSP